MVPNLKEFRSPTGNAVKVWSDDLAHSALIEEKWQPIREDLWRAAYAQGCISKDMATRNLNPEQELAHMKSEEIIYHDSIIATMKKILDEGDPDKIDSAGRPKISAIAEFVDPQPSARLRNKLLSKITGV